MSIGMMDAMDSAAFMLKMRDEFPQFREDLDDPTWKGLLHVETGCLARACQAAIDGRDRDLVRRYMDFVDRMWRLGDNDVQNAISVSFFENLDFRDERKKRSWAIDEIPTAVAEVARRLSSGVPE